MVLMLFFMESVDDLFLSLEQSIALRQAGILFDNTVALRNKEYDSVSMRKGMFTIISTLHVPAPSTEEIWLSIPKSITLDDIKFFLMTSVDLESNAVSWYEAEDGAATDMIYGEDLKTCLANQIIHLIKEEIVTTSFINRRQWESIK
jgi:hypothetical protein